MPVTERTQIGLQWGCVLLLWLAFAAHAQVPVPDLHEARLVVPEGVPEDRAALFDQGLDQVVRRLAGPDVRLTDVRAEAMVSRYGYQRDSRGQLLFVVGFAEGSVEAALARQGSPLWEEPRPATLLWLTAGPGAAAITEGAADPVLAELKRRAWVLGLPLHAPPAGFRSSPGDDPASLMTGLLGDGVQAVLAIEATSLSDGRWSAAFRTFIDGQLASSWTVAPASLETLIDAGLQRHEALLRGRFAQAAMPQQPSRVVHIAVSGIARYSDYARVAAELQSQRALSDLFLEEARPMEFVWRADTTVPSESMLGLLEAGGRLQGRLTRDTADPDRLELQWVAAP